MSTFIEEYMEKLAALPPHVKRNFELIKALDETTADDLEELKERQDRYLSEARKRIQSNTVKGVNLRALAKDSDALAYIKQTQKACLQRAEDKVAVAQQTYTFVDQHIKRLTTELDRFEEHLKRTGGWDKSFALFSEPDAGSVAGSAVESVVPPTRQVPKFPKRGRAPRKASEFGAAEEGIAIPEESTDPNEPLYCICKRVSFGDMVGCDNDSCPIEWFHYQCVGLTEPPKGKWYCPQCRSDEGSHKMREGF